MIRNTSTPASDHVLVRRHEDGYVAEGPGFYIWDEDAAEVRRAAEELSRGITPEPPPQRLLVVLAP